MHIFYIYCNNLYVVISNCMKEQIVINFLVLEMYVNILYNWRENNLFKFIQQNTTNESSHRLFKQTELFILK